MASVLRVQRVLCTTKVKGGMLVYSEFVSPDLLNYKVYNPGEVDVLAAIRK